MTRKFHFNWKVSAFALICLVVFFRLGFWQLDREEEKRALIAERALQLNDAPMSASSLSQDGDVSGTPVLLSGTYDESITLLQDNVVLGGKVGFEVHQLFEDVTGKSFVVDRGFVQMGRTRQDPVEIPAVDPARQSLKGVVYVGTGAPLAEASDLTASFPQIVQRVSIAQLESLLGRELYPAIIRVAEDQPGALPRYWPYTVMSPEQHFGYALQWFTMAFAVLVAWLFFSFRKEEVE